MNVYVYTFFFFSPECARLQSPRFCLGQKEVVTAAHNACIRELLQEINVHGKADRHMKLLTLERESSLGSLWDQEQCTVLLEG
jgi:hypothetical protein